MQLQSSTPNGLTVVDQLKQAIVRAGVARNATALHWTLMHSIGEWRRRLQCVVDQNGGQVEHT